MSKFVKCCNKVLQKGRGHGVTNHSTQPISIMHSQVLLEIGKLVAPKLPKENHSFQQNPMASVIHCAKSYLAQHRQAEWAKGKLDVVGVAVLLFSQLSLTRSIITYYKNPHDLEFVLFEAGLWLAFNNKLTFKGSCWNPFPKKTHGMGSGGRF